MAQIIFAWTLLMLDALTNVKVNHTISEYVFL